MAEFTRKDIFQTSTGVGHHYRPGYYFPSSKFQAVIGEPLPPTLVNPDEVPFGDRFKTSSGTAHDRKHIGGPYGNDDELYKKAPGHWKVDYNRNVHEKLGSGAYRKPLTMGNQTSETQEEFRNQPGLHEPHEFKYPNGYTLNNHLNDGPSKLMAPNTRNNPVAGRTFYPKNKGVLDLNEPYLTTTGKAHRVFNPKELDGYSRKEVPTYWECEEYTKAWGHGMKHNPLPKNTVPRERLPMRDKPMFDAETKIRRVPDKSIPVPHGGLKSLYKESFNTPSDVKAKQADYCPLDKPYNLPDPSNRAVFTAPQMYKTEYQNVGSKKPVVI